MLQPEVYEVSEIENLRREVNTGEVQVLERFHPPGNNLEGDRRASIRGSPAHLELFEARRNFGESPEKRQQVLLVQGATEATESRFV